ncbi:MAG: hypothetical protein SGARI_000360 [Bacillariaceae sp.]
MKGIQVDTSNFASVQNAEMATKSYTMNAEGELEESELEEHTFHGDCGSLYVCGDGIARGMHIGLQAGMEPDGKLIEPRVWISRLCTMQDIVNAHAQYFGRVQETSSVNPSSSLNGDCSHITQKAFIAQEIIHPFGWTGEGPILSKHDYSSSVKIRFPGCNTYNVGVKILVCGLIGIGLFCASYSNLSCRWVVYGDGEDPANDWTFLPTDETTVGSIGLFRYQVAVEGVDSRDIQCTQYNPLMAGGEYPWLFVTQILSIIATVLSSIACLFAVAGRNKNPVAALLMFAFFTQGASIISTFGWCDNSNECPTIIGGHVCMAAAFTFFVGWILAWWVQAREDANVESPNDSMSAKVEPSVCKMTVEEVPVADVVSSIGEETSDQDQTAADLLGTDDQVVIRQLMNLAELNRDVKSRLQQRRPMQDDTNDYADDEASRGSTGQLDP